MKPPLFLLAGLIFGVLICGLATLERRVLVLAIPLLVYFFSAVVQRPEELRFSVQREILPGRAPQGTPLQVKLVLTNQGPAVDEVLVEESLPEGIEKIEGESAVLTRLGRQGRVELAYAIRAGRGEYKAYDVQVSAGDCCGFFSMARVERTNPALVIHPRYPRLDRIKVRPPQLRGFAGPISSRQGGAGVDFYGVREYQPGDPQRQINWKIAARREQELFTNVFEQERVADVGLILDGRERLDVSSPAGSLFEHSVRAAAALAENFLSDGNRVSLLVYGSGLESVFPGYGRIQKDRILKALAKARPGMNYALDSLGNLPTRFFPAKSQIVLISPLSPDDIPVIKQMRAHGYVVLVISPDPISYISALRSDFSSQPYRLAFAERDFMLHQLRRSGMQVINWRVDQPLELVVRDALSRQPAVMYQHGMGI
jgi:uncharacterized protein (DUF58 family)